MQAQFDRKRSLFLPGRNTETVTTIQTSITLRRKCGDTRQRSPSQSSDIVRSFTRTTTPTRSRKCLSVKPALSPTFSVTCLIGAGCGGGAARAEASGTTAG